MTKYTPSGSNSRRGRDIEEMLGKMDAIPSPKDFRDLGQSEPWVLHNATRNWRVAPASGHQGTGIRDDRGYRAKVREVVAKVVAEGRRVRQTEPLGALGVCSMRRLKRGAVPRSPWFEERRKMVVWDDPRVAEVRGYLDEYWDHQRAFREASRRWLEGRLNARFPVGSFRPGIPRPVTPKRVKPEQQAA